MRIGVLLCDDVTPELQVDHLNYPNMFESILLNADPSLALTFYRVMEGQYPTDIDECDGYIISGSRFSVYDDLPWIKRFEAFVLTLYTLKKPTVGICFGHQMMAQALGGEVERSTNGWGVGIATSAFLKDDITQAESWIDPNVHDFSLVVSHQDQVSILPPGSKPLAGNAFCPISMYTVGGNFLAIQGHPEFSRDYSHDLMEFRRDRIPKDVISAGQTSLSRHADSERVTAWMLAFLRHSAAKS
ncbi:glutamine amidotransferase-related protein [Enterovibrio norvegicus]|uniref:glutamine amidotransferase-related protein n=1 Tax=Enterovibrio norvegicus TaxID=188144 RepID=UPI000C85EAB3|nr:GMP synthase [Enterovibrio norvegicus]PML81197.1 GMP synthase [Enterovibrio norvegicus]